MTAASSSPRSDSYDVVCIGGGHNALVAAALLARSGRSVAVLDRNDRPGGFVRTEEILPGCLIDRFSAAHPQFTTGPAFAALSEDLQARGLTYVDTDRPTGVSMADRSTAVLPRDPAELFAEADRLSPGDGTELSQMIDQLGPALGDLVTATDVTGIDTHAGRAVGVRTRAGDHLRATEAVIASVNPDQLYLHLLPQHDVPVSLRTQARAYRYGSGQVQINLAPSHPLSTTRGHRRDRPSCASR